MSSQFREQFIVAGTLVTLGLFYWYYKYQQNIKKQSSEMSENTHMDKIDRFTYTKNKWLTEEVSMSPLPESIRFLTYNVWFGDHYFEERTEALLKMFEKTNPDVICLQEVTNRLLMILNANPMIQNNYSMSDLTGETYQGYGVLILAKKHFYLHHYIKNLPSRMGRKILIADMYFNHSNGKQFLLTVGTVHLESLLNAPIRKKQLEIILSLLHQNALVTIGNETKSSERSDCILMGDMNYDRLSEPCKEEEVVEKNGYKDVWMEVYPNDPSGGITRQKFKNVTGRRIDRVFFKGAHLKPKLIEVVGKEDIGNDCKGCKEEKGACCLSDHYGIVTEFQIIS